MPATSEPASGSERQNETSLNSLVHGVEPALLLLVAAADDDRHQAEVVAHDRGRHAGAAPGQLLDGDARVEHREPDAAVDLRDAHRDETQLPGLLDDLARELAGLVVVGGGRRDLGLGEAARGLLERELLVVEREVHGGLLSEPRERADREFDPRSLFAANSML